jgi:hypothetical protein
VVEHTGQAVQGDRRVGALAWILEHAPVGSRRSSGPPATAAPGLYLIGSQPVGRWIRSRVTP